MLHILWMLLKIIGIIILIILGLVLVTLGVVLLVPLKYYGLAELNQEIKRSTANIKFSWLLHLISGNVSFEDKHLTYELRLFGKKLKLDNTVEEDTESKQIEEEVEAKSKETDEKASENSPSSLAKEITEKVVHDVVGTNEKETKKVEKSAKKKKTKKESILKKIKYTFQNICDKIKLLKQKKDEIEAFLKNEDHKSALKKVWKELVKLLKALRPKKLILNAHFGFEDPSLTGKILAVLSMLYPFYGDNIRIQPDFENVIIEGDLELKGKIRLIHAVRMAWNLVWNKNVRITVKDIIKWFK